MASNVYVKKTQFEKFFQKDLDNLPINSDELTFHENKFNFISHLLTLLHTNSDENPLEDLLNIVNILLKIPNKQFEEDFFTQFTPILTEIDNMSTKLIMYNKTEYSSNQYLKFLRVIRVFILKCPDFNIYEKGDLCKLERFLMKICLKQMNSKD
jgi:hypothetical protein